MGFLVEVTEIKIVPSFISLNRDVRRIAGRDLRRRAIRVEHHDFELRRKQLDVPLEVSLEAGVAALRIRKRVDGVVDGLIEIIDLGLDLGGDGT